MILLFIFVTLSVLLSIYFAWMMYKLRRFGLSVVIGVFSAGFYTILLFFTTDMAILLTLFYLVVLFMQVLKLSKIIVKAHESN